LCETLKTNDIHVRLLSGVCPDVFLQIARISELPTTSLPTANECVPLVIIAVYFHMTLETGSTVEAPATDITYIHALFDVSSEMSIQVVLV
jgi:hypothetical protein